MTTRKSEPRNAQEAMQQAVRLERAKAILAEGYRFVKDAGSEVVAVCKPGMLKATYWINLLSEGCDCPDYMKTGLPRKHMVAYQLLQDEQAGEAAMWEAQCKQWEEDNFLDAIPTPTLESIAAKDLYQRMSADLQRVEMAIHTHGTRLVNPIQCQQDRNRAAALQCAVHIVSEYR